MLLKVFGRNPSGDELKKVQASNNYQNNSFHNLVPTQVMQDVSKFSVLRKVINKPKTAVPPTPLPSIKTDVKSLPDNAPVIVWFGHSSYLIKINGKHILVDPVFSGHASPFSFLIKSFAGTDIYNIEDFPPIDVLLITHDHFDHLDYETVKKIIPKTSLICTSIGIASHLRYWDIKTKITEFDWWNSKEILPGMQLSALPARHFSGRSFVRNKTLWSAFVLETNDCKILIGGDSGYGDHFKAINKKFTSFDIAILECGQYNEAWHNIHMMPEETAKACIDLNSKVLMPVHWAKFSLALHPWDEPIRRLCQKADELKIQLTTPKIGEPVIVNNTYPASQWWNL